AARELHAPGHRQPREAVRDGATRGWEEHDEALVVARGRHGLAVEVDRTDDGVDDAHPAGPPDPGLVLAPQHGELGALLAELSHQLGRCGVAGSATGHRRA